MKTIGFVKKRALKWWSYCCFSPGVPLFSQAQSGCQKAPHAGAFFSKGSRECVCRWSSCPCPVTSRWWGSPESYTRPEPGSTFHIWERHTRCNWDRPAAESPDQASNRSQRHLQRKVTEWKNKKRLECRKGYGLVYEVQATTACKCIILQNVLYTVNAEPHRDNGIIQQTRWELDNTHA